MNAIRKSILAYLAPGQASVAALCEGTGLSQSAIRSELMAMIEERLVTTDTITATLKGRPRFKVTVYRLVPSVP